MRHTLNPSGQTYLDDLVPHPVSDNQQEKPIDSILLTENYRPEITGATGLALFGWRGIHRSPAARNRLDRAVDAGEIYCGRAGPAQKRLQSVKIFYMIGRSSQEINRYWPFLSDICSQIAKIRVTVSSECRLKIG
jgi:hypothetical protein